MRSTLDESTSERSPEIQAGCAAACGKEVKEAVRRVEKGVNDAKAAVAETLDDGKTAARRFMKRSRFAVEDGIEDAAHAIKHHPFRSIAIGFAAGAALGLLVPRFGRK